MKPHLIAAALEPDILARLPEPEAGARESFRIQAAANDTAELELYDVLWPWEPKRMMAALRETKAKTINLRINSPGGDVFGGVAIYNALVRHPARVIVDIDGLAASIASVVAMAGDEIRMGKGTFMMIHNSHLFAGGDAKFLRDTAALLDKVDVSMADIYAERSGKTPADVLGLMADETWFTEAEAVKAGFADSATAKPAAAASFDLSIYAKAPREIVALAAPRKIETVRDFEAFLRDAGGFSRAAARAIAAGGYKGTTPEPRDEDGGGRSVMQAIAEQLARTQLATALTH